MGAVLQFAISLESHTCWKCGIEYAMPTAWAQKRREDHSLNFFCPAGHAAVFCGETEAQKLQRQLDAKEREVEAERRRTEMVKTELRGARIAEGKARAETSRIRQRVGGGTCPCCKRNFSQLRRHMEHQHPDFRPVPAQTRKGE